MRILVCNDDGINSAGIHALVNKIKTLGEVIVSAPVRQMSGYGHSITVDQKVKVEKVEFEPGIPGFAVYGTPRDCAELGVKAFVGEEPVDLIITGINKGSNLVNNVPSSGTCGSACTGLDFGIPAIAISLDFGQEYDFDLAAAIALDVTKWFLQQPFNKDFMLSVNVPNCPKEEIRGYQVCDFGGTFYFHQNLEPDFDGQYYYYDTSSSAFSFPDLVEDLSGDVYALSHNYITLTPIDLDMVNKKGLEALKSASGLTFNK